MTKYTYPAIFLVFLMALSAGTNAQIINTIAGTGVGTYTSDGVPATTSALHNPTTSAVDGAGNVYIADWGNHRVRKINTSGIITTIAGTGTAGYGGDGAAATLALLNLPNGVAFDAVGNLYVAEQGGHRVRKISTTGIITTVAGTGSSGYTGDGSAATLAKLNTPGNCVIDAAGNIYIADWGNSVIRKVSTAGIITTIAGTGVATYGGDGGMATAAQLNHPYSVSLDLSNHLYISDEYNNRLRVLDLTTGIITLVGGNGVAGSGGDGGPATAAQFFQPDGIVADAGNLYVADTRNNKIRKIDLASGIVTTYAGTGVAGSGGDGGSPATAQLNTPSGVVLDLAGNVYISDFNNHKIRKIDRNNHQPLFDSGHVQRQGLCLNTSVSIDYKLPVTDSDIGQTLNWTLYIAPLHGTIYVGASAATTGSTLYTATSTGGVVTTSGISYVPAVGYVGADSFVVRVNDGISVDSTKILINVRGTPNPDSISGPSNVCVGSTITLTDDTLGGTWHSQNSNASVGSTTGVVTGVSVGTDTILYIVTNSCGTDTVSKIITVIPGISPIQPTGPLTICIGTSAILSDSTSGGVWTSTNTTVATVGSSSGIVIGVSAGVDTIRYTIGGCFVTKVVTVVSTPSPITGSLTTCVGGTTTLSDVVTGGTWTSGSTGVATVGSSSGIVTGVSIGTAAITYSLGAGCTVVAIVTVTAAPAAISPASTTVCVGSTVTLTDSSPGGSWTSGSTGVATVGTSGVVTGVSTGVAIITYSLGSCFVTATVTVNAGPSAISPSSASVCVGGTTTLTDATGGGTWSSSSTGVATVSSGVVTGVALGTAIISYNVGSCSATATVSVLATPAPISPSSAVVCAGSTVTLTESVGGGIWTSGNPAIATVSGGVVTGVTAGAVTISYAIGSCFVTAAVTVNTAPAAITPPGAAIVCVASTLLLADATSGGTWSSSNTAVATVSAGGLVTGVSAGVVTISYSIGSCFAIKTVTVNPGPAAISPASPSVCVGSSVALTDATGGGTWSSSNTGVATIGSTSGVVIGVSAGTATITYSTGGSCIAIAIVTVQPTPVSISPSGPVSVCVGTTTSLSDATPGGTWTSTATSVATVGTSGVVTGVSVGVTIISYTIGSCAASKIVTVIATVAGITPASAAVCAGNTATYTDATGGGTWSSSNTAIATIGSMGIATGVSAGTATISYSVGSCFVLATLTVNANPAAISPGTPVAICAGTTTTLSDGTPGGTWSSSNTAVATVGSTGIVTGISAGTATITYTTGSGCTAVKPITINTMPVAISPATAQVCAGATVTFTDGTVGGTWTSSDPSTGSIDAATGLFTGIAPGTVTITYALGSCSVTAAATVNANPSAISPGTPVILCVGTTTTLSDGSPGGTWSSSNTSVATIGSTGTVTAVSAGVTTISYTNASGCSATKDVTVGATPTVISPLSGNVCVGGTLTLTNGSLGGTWTSSNTSVATIGSSSGVVSGITAGTVTISYAIGSCSTTSTVTVSIAASAGTVSGPTAVCTGSTITLTDGAPGGTWSSSNTAVATVGSTGIVTGVSAGTATISYTVINTCGPVSATATVTVTSPGVQPITGLSTICAGTFTTYSDATGGGTWSVSNANATITGTGLLTGITPGTDTIRYTVTNVCGTFSTTKSVTIGPYLTAATISGPSVVCVGSTITVTDPAPGGVWSSSNTSVATVSSGGVVTGTGGGVDTILYTVTASCGSAVAQHPVTVNPLPDAGGISGSATMCAGTIGIYTETVPGGVWSLSNTTIATISSTGVVTAISPGTDTIRYTVTNSCGTATATKVVTIGAFLTAGTVSGPGTLCAGSTVTLTDGTAGGTWSSSNTAVATVGSTGIVTGITAGSATISYTVTSSCGSATATAGVTVNPLPDAGTISGPGSLCTGGSATYTDGASGGTWSVTNSHATISGGGLLTAVSAGTDTILYSVTNSCGTAMAVFTVTIGSTATAGTISGPTAVCAGSTVTLSDATGGGTWSSSNTSVATVGSTGVVTGVSAGTATISYMVSGSCGTATATYAMTVGLSAVAGTISGSTVMCAGTFTLYTTTGSGGVWSSSNTSLATVSGGGVVTAIAPGTDTIYYTVTTACGSASALHAVTILTGVGAGTISGPGSVCAGSTITLTDGTGGGTWSSSNTAVATVGSTGIVTGITAGTATISYTVSGGCGSATATYTVSVASSGGISAITGPSAVCVGSLIILSDATPGGAWGASNGTATITTGGVVTGITPGTDTITYSVVSACGSGMATKIINISMLPSAGPITGPSGVCVGAAVLYTDGTPGGAWSVSNGHATAGSTTGIVNGVSAGPDTVIYTVTTGCGTVSVTAPISINPLPDAGTITGPDSVCTGSSITLLNSTGGGTWSAGNGNATVSGGIVTGVSAGTTPVSYSVTNGCGTAVAVHIVTIVSFPTSGTITGPAMVCAGSGITLTDGIGGGTWATSNGNAVVAGPGIIDGVTVGIDTIFYIVGNACSISTTSRIITINPVPVVTPVSGSTSQCVGTTGTLTDAVGGGVWTSSNPLIATVGVLSGVVTGVSTGVATITYTVTNSFGCPTSVTAQDTINTMPAPGPILGSADVCAGSSVPLSNAMGGGTWSSSAPAVAGIDATTGVVTGITAGVSTITYTITNSCGTSSVTRTETVHSLPVVSAIAGTRHQCVGASSLLTDATAGGIWVSNNTSVAVVDSVSGIVTGISPGITTINYIYTGAFGCTAVIFTPDTVVASPVVSPVAGVASECIGGTTTLTDATPGGVWSSSSPLTATVSSTGVVTGVAAGTATINYSVTNGSGCTTTTGITDTVNGPPVVWAISGPGHVCPGAAITLTDSIPGGVWSLSNGNATISGTGVVTGVITGMDTAMYTVTGTCGSTSVWLSLMIDPLPFAGAISGASNLCVGGSTMLTDTISPGGVWSATNGNAVADTTGMITGMTTGTDTILYTVTGLCGSATASHIITVMTLPATAGTISGATILCKGATVTLSDTIGGGVWSASNTNATVSGTGMVTGVNTGMDTIVYTVSNMCGSVSAAHGVTVITTPSAGTITGAATVCAGSVAGLSVSGGATGGAWSSSNASVATVSGGGVVTGIAPGGVSISYTVSNSCGSRSTGHPMTVLSVGQCHTEVGSVSGADEIRVYPNPASTVVYITAPVRVEVVVMSADGREVMRQQDARELNVGALADGVYLLKVYDDSKELLLTTKFVKMQ